MANTIPNLDAMHHEDLWAFYLKYMYNGKLSDFRELIGDKRRGYTKLANLISCYACNKSIANRCRLNGDISGAHTYELVCESIYDRLPKDLRW